MAKFGATSTPTSGLPVELRARRASSLSWVPAGRPHDDVRPTIDAVGDVDGRGVRHRELDHDVSATEVTEVVAQVEATYQLEVRRGLDGTAYLRTHASCGADDRDLDDLDRVAHPHSLVRR